MSPQVLLAFAMFCHNFQPMACTKQLVHCYDAINSTRSEDATIYFCINNYLDTKKK